MSRVSPKQILIKRLLAFVFVLGGSAAGYLLGRQVVIWESLRKLEQFSKLALAQNDASLEQARQILYSMKHYKGAACSDDEIGYLRDLVFRSANLKDAGRVQGNRIKCSATTGGTARSIASIGFDTSWTKGGLIYYHLKTITKSDPNRAALQVGNSFVVIDTGEILNQNVDPVRLAVTTKSGSEMQAGSNAGLQPQIDESTIAQDGSGQFGATLFATRCSSLGFNCITLSVPAAYVMQNGNLAIAASTAVGAMVGLLLWTLLSKAHSRRQDLPSQLRRGVERGELQVVYQPIVNLATQMIVGAEALARWTDHEGRTVEPDTFIKVAEEHGFIGEITKLVLKRILQDFAMTLRSRRGFRISINVSADDLSDPRFLPMLDESLKQAKVKPESLVVEITERSASDSLVAMETIRNLRRMGHSIHIDDFGTGHSNLDKLLYLFADTIKIDKTFTRVIGTESIAAAILPQILTMARSLNLEVVVEGVETNSQSDYFSSNEQKIHAQGWLYGRPTTAEGILSQLANNQPVVQDSPEVIETGETEPGALYIVKSHVA
jgi:sensor c-di-GMP phosphodiesterase-like protein